MIRALALASALSACAPFPSAVSVPVVAAAAGTSTAAADKPAAGRERPLIELTLRASGTTDPAAVIVSLRFSGPGEIGELRFGANVDGVESLAAHDAGGSIAVERDKKDQAKLVFARAPVLPFELGYRVRAATDVESSEPLSTAVDPTRLRVSGERALALPSAWDDRGVDVDLTIDAGDLRGDAGASSFGFGREKKFRALGGELRRASYLAGRLGNALFNAGDAHDELVWLGDTAFDPRIVAADFAAFRSAASAQLGKDPAPLTVLLVADGRSNGDLRTTRRTASALMHIGVGDPFASDARVALATAIVERWVGEKLWLGPERDAPENAWFSEGLPRGLAAVMAYRFGTLSSNEYAEELTRLFAVAATSRWRSEDNHALAAAMRRGEGGALVVARGALYALRVDGELHKKRSDLAALVSELMVRADDHRAVTRQDWLTAIANHLGGDPSLELQRFIERGEAPALDPGALGKCFRIAPRDYALYAAGFDIDATLKAQGQHPVALDPKGPAARAGLTATDAVVFANWRAGRTDTEVMLAVERPTSRDRIHYFPLGDSVRGSAVERVAGVPEGDCAR